MTAGLRSLILGALLPVLAGCDPGMRLRPPGWTRDGWHGPWGDLEISCDGITNLVGFHSGYMGLIVRNRGTHACDLLEAPLIARGRVYSGKLNSGEYPVRVAPKLYEKCSLSWEFEDRISRVCGDGCVVLLRFECDGKPQEIRLELKEPP